MDPTLPQRLYLLTYTVEKGRFEVVDLQGRGQLLRAGALAELAFGGLLATEGGKVHRMVTEPPADPFLREVWSDLPVKKPKGWLQFVYPTAHMAEAPVTEQLAGAGAIRRPEGRHRGLGSYHRTTVTDPDQVLALQEAVRNAVRADQAAVPEDVLALVVLAVECEVTTVFSHKELREHKQALKALAARFDKLVPGLRRALRDAFLVSRGAGAGYGV